MEKEVNAVLRENAVRIRKISAPFDALTGLGSVGRRFRLELPDFRFREQWLPVAMKKNPLVKQLVKAGGVNNLLYSRYGREKYEGEEGEKKLEKDRDELVKAFTDLRIKHDFPFWAAWLINIKNKGGGPDVKFRLTRPQRRLVAVLERMRLAGKPIRLILLKARQWGGSTTIQLYMMWLQLVHEDGLNSLIIAHQSVASTEIKEMFARAMRDYPARLLHPPGGEYNEGEAKLVGVGQTGAVFRVPQRNCTIKLGTAERPDSCRGGDYNLVHLSEVGIWKKTEGKSPEDIVRSAVGGVLNRPGTMIVYESTANGTGNFFHTEYQDAKDGHSAFEALFISWFDIDLYSEPFASAKERQAFARELWEKREDESRPNNRQATGRYLWWLWEKGATLEAIHWYVNMRATYHEDAIMHSEYPSDDVEAFVHSGAMVFDKYLVERFRSTCMPPQMTGDVYADGDEGKDALKNVRFRKDGQGLFWVWNPPEKDDKERILNRYLVVVDIGGRSVKADWSVIVVFDRLFQMDGGPPMVVAQWYGHIDMDLLAWKAAQIAAWYDNALLVIESNTLETHDREREVDGDQSQFILNQVKRYYDNLYARKQSPEEIVARAEKKYGFHTNVATKPMVISTLVKVVREYLYIERDARCVDELLVYERKQNGAYGAIPGRHDDLLMTRAIGLHVSFYEMDLPKVIVVGTLMAAVRRKRKNTDVGVSTI